MSTAMKSVSFFFFVFLFHIMTTYLCMYHSGAKSFLIPFLIMQLLSTYKFHHLFIYHTLEPLTLDVSKTKATFTNSLTPVCSTYLDTTIFHQVHKSLIIFIFVLQKSGLAKSAYNAIFLKSPSIKSS